MDAVDWSRWTHQLHAHALQKEKENRRNQNHCNIYQTCTAPILVECEQVHINYVVIKFRAVCLIASKIMLWKKAHTCGLQQFCVAPPKLHFGWRSGRSFSHFIQWCSVEMHINYIRPLVIMILTHSHFGSGYGSGSGSTSLSLLYSFFLCLFVSLHLSKSGGRYARPRYMKISGLHAVNIILLVHFL